MSGFFKVVQQVNVNVIKGAEYNIDRIDTLSPGMWISGCVKHNNVEVFLDEDGEGLVYIPLFALEEISENDELVGNYDLYYGEV